MIAMMGALREELLGVQKGMVIERSRREEGCCIFEGKWGEKDFLLAQTGVGRERAERATEVILDSYRLEALVSLGFAAGVDKRLKAGDLILCSAVRWLDGPLDGNTERMEGERSSENLVLLASVALEKAPVSSCKGDLLTVPDVVSSRKTKEWIGEHIPVKAIDMESYWIARKAKERETPFLAVRAIFDSVTDTLPPFSQSLNSSGSWRKGELMRHFLVQPWEIVRLGFKARRARKSLNAFVDGFMEQIQGSPLARGHAEVTK